jgi:hypothetical protein
VPDLYSHSGANEPIEVKWKPRFKWGKSAARTIRSADETVSMPHDGAHGQNARSGLQNSLRRVAFSAARRINTASKLGEARRVTAKVVGSPARR